MSYHKVLHTIAHGSRKQLEETPSGTGLGLAVGFLGGCALAPVVAPTLAGWAVLMGASSIVGALGAASMGVVGASSILGSAIGTAIETGLTERK
ncbi:hypothetical protein [Calothrix sp. 336/3]|uniref:hypothetical protein n=1 Tax=Calothrix sp. 336/3 TaxID=1337936 RepID=UPI0004E3E911|nr:hypothetical protein [Calothrix sp. 336/3]AKG24917.1 hypothetical protein IJ00_26620 [Calothrix sp. 336/3]